MRKKVVIAQHRLLHYRVKFFEQLHEKAQAEGIDLHLLHGQPSPEEAKKRDTGVIEWADVVTNRFWRLGNTDLLWQPVPPHLRDADLFVLLHQNRLLSNYPIMLSQRLAGRKVAFWGHGANFQSTSPGDLKERWKRWQIDKVDFWFAYTGITVELLRKVGVPDGRIVNLNNAVDTSEFRAQCEAVMPEEVGALRAELGIPEGAPTAVFCGSLYPEKRLDLMVAACDIVRTRLPDFHLAVIGSGPSLGSLEEAARERPWLHPVGIRMGVEKAR
ncbi:MAG TPA: glycosyltransferase, partial [Azospirillaceae bacterium]|nr:glycosyltransferase [Azospirillaceae bacterium]